MLRHQFLYYLTLVKERSNIVYPIILFCYNIIKWPSSYPTPLFLDACMLEAADVPG